MMSAKEARKLSGKIDNDVNAHLARNIKHRAEDGGTSAFWPLPLGDVEQEKLRELGYMVEKITDDFLRNTYKITW